jgi:hypothetical protein
MTTTSKKFKQSSSAARLLHAGAALMCVWVLQACGTTKPVAEASSTTEVVRVRFLRPSERAAIANAEQRVSRTPRANPQSGGTSDIAALFGGPSIRNNQATEAVGQSSASTAEPTIEDSWLVVLLTIDAQSPGAAETAAIAAEEVRSQGGLSQARAVLRGDAWLVVAAEFSREQDEAAREEHTRIRSLKFDQAQPFAAATLLAPAKRGEAGTLPEFDLATLRGRIPAGVEYTLQIGIYQVDDGTEVPTEKQLKEIRAAAETAVKTLRADGVEAFYWHGPTRSTVTVGLFREADIQRTAREGGKEIVVPQRSEKLAAAQAAFPQNLVNGMAIRVRVQGADTPDRAPAGKAGGFQPSFLIRIPKQ